MIRVIDLVSEMIRVVDGESEEEVQRTMIDAAEEFCSKVLHDAAQV